MTDALALHGERMSMIWEQGDGVPRWRHWGARIEPVPPFCLEEVRGAATFSMDADVPLDLAPTLGAGWFGPAALVAHRDGRQLVHSWAVAECRHDGRSLLLTLRDAAAGIELEQRIAIDPASDVVTLSASVTNRGDVQLAVEWLASGVLPLPAHCRSIRSFTGRHNQELGEAIELIPRHAWRREQRRGLTGHGGPPGLFVMGEGAGWHVGEVWAAQLAWSGNHLLAVERDDQGSWILSAGAALAPSEIRLDPGQRHDAPELLVTWSGNGLNPASQNFHSAVRARCDRPIVTPRKVHLNSWEGFYFDHDEPRLMALATDAAKIGVERFVLDDGWFRGRDDARAGLGDWIPDPRKYPRGLGPLADHVVGLGMEFGLWVEPEMVNPDSDLYRAHPEWALGSAAGIALPTARHQLVLDLGRAEVQDYLFAALDALLVDLPIAYLKWDHNRDLAPQIGADGRASGHRQTLGAYTLIDRLRAAHPAVEIEACAGGGGRSDAGMARRVDRFWTSDNLDAVSRVAIQRGFLAFLPPEMMGAHVGASPAHATGRSQSLDFLGAVALPGHFGVELDPATLAADDRAALAAAIARYKGLRERLHHGRTWLGDGADGIVWHAVGAPDSLVLMVTRTAPMTERRPQPIRLPMCRGGGPLAVSLIDLAGGAAMPPTPWFEQIRATARPVDGDWLAEVGLPIPPLKAVSMAIFSIGSPA